MIVIADSNLIISALYSPTGTIATILKTEKNVQFMAPDFIFTETTNHFTEIGAAINKSKKELHIEFKKIVANIKFVPVSKIPIIHITRAISIVQDIDIDDTFFVALHLYKKHKIWTCDKALINGLEKKGYKICITTAELKLKLYKKK